MWRDVAMSLCVRLSDQGHIAGLWYPYEVCGQMLHLWNACSLISLNSVYISGPSTEHKAHRQGWWVQVPTSLAGHRTSDQVGIIMVSVIPGCLSGSYIPGWARDFSPGWYCIQLWIRPFLFSPYVDPRLIRPVLNLPTLQISCIILLYNSISPILNSPSRERAKRKRGRN